MSHNGGPQFISHELASFLEKWGVKHRRSSPYNPHANLRAETAVKTAKRILTSNTKSDGSPNWDDIKRALLQHRNTPLQDLAISPAQMLFGRPIRDHLPVKPGLFKPSEVWVTSRDHLHLLVFILHTEQPLLDFLTAHSNSKEFNIRKV